MKSISKLIRLIWQSLVLAFGLLLPTVASAFSPFATLFTYDEQIQTIIPANFGNQLTFDYDSSAKLVANEDGRTAQASGLFGSFAKFLAAKETGSLLPARSPWPGNSGFIEGTVERKFLMPGETFDRYGFGGGRFVSPAGTPFEARALRAGTENLPFNTYQVVKPFEVNAGGIQPWFGKPGLGT